MGEAGRLQPGLRLRSCRRKRRFQSDSSPDRGSHHMSVRASPVSPVSSTLPLPVVSLRDPGRHHLVQLCFPRHGNRHVAYFQLSGMAGGKGGAAQAAAGEPEEPEERWWSPRPGCKVTDAHRSHVLTGWPNSVPVNTFSLVRRLRSSKTVRCFKPLRYLRCKSLQFRKCLRLENRAGGRNQTRGKAQDISRHLQTSEQLLPWSGAKKHHLLCHKEENNLFEHYTPFKKVTPLVLFYTASVDGELVVVTPFP